MLLIHAVLLFISTLVAGFFGLFVFWQTLTTEHVDNKAKLFDKTFIALLCAFIVGRLSFIVLKPNLFGLTLTRWLDVVSYPGLLGVVVIIVALLIWKRLLTDTWKDHFELLDFGVTGLTLALSIISLGEGVADVVELLFTLSTRHQQGSSLLIQLLAHLFLSIAYFILYLFLHHTEKVYRTYLWYRAKRRNSQSGFVLACFLIGYGLVGFVFGWFQPPTLLISTVPVDPFIKLLVMVGGFMVLYVRSGRNQLVKK